MANTTHAGETTADPPTKGICGLPCKWAQTCTGGLCGEQGPEGRVYPWPDARDLARRGRDDSRRVGAQLRALPASDFTAEQRRVERELDEIHSERRIRRDRYEAHLDGMGSIGPDEYSGQWWTLDKRAELELLAEMPAEPPYHDGVMDRTPRRMLRRLPNGDVMEVVGGQAWNRWTADPDLLVDHYRRSAIKAHRYAPALLTALVDLGRKGALRSALGSWFGGPLSDEQIETRTVPTYAGGRARSGDEKQERLRAWLDECSELHPAHAEALRDARALVIEGSIEAVSR